MKAVTIGKQAEQAALIYLQNQGLTRVMENFKTKAGEIDLIMRHARHLVFIEVRFRSNLTYGLPQETITYSKQQRIIKAAQWFLLRKPSLTRYPCRFDVLAMRQVENVFQFEWLQNAFQAV